ncbi:MAG: TerB family tellurite resistance protein [Bacteroidetes bacterium]|nr:TerB family tellurite resistance protein [Bacteroidota bacterium]MBU1678376.1 TerB family tellurite resistance protein [Bacteroidota bacterium]MBU2505351.1 TerB family tellurite resistance protein [Bacteroidota bacterium]
MTTIDRSNYFRGLLLLISKDNKIDTEERSLMMSVGKVLGFEEKFCKTAIDEILENDFILPDAPKFSDVEIAKSFLIDSINFALSDSDLDPEELEYINQTAIANEINLDWLEDRLKDRIAAYQPSSNFNLSILNVLTE